ncbi:DUF2786 domain-containing protein, partial [Kibdelosporangium lantanae]
MSTTTQERTRPFEWFRSLGSRGRRAFVGAFGGYGLDSYDFQVLPLGMVAITAYFGLTKPEAGLLTTVTLVVSAIAAENETYAPATVHPRWQQQLAETGASTWWDPSRPWITQWADREHLTQVETLAHAIALLAHVLRLTRLPMILPLPGTAHASAVSNVGVDHKVLARVRALLAKAESTPYPHEAESLTAKAQELMNRHAFSRALLDVAPQSATSQRIWLDTPYLSAKYQLVNVIADANRARAVFYRDLGLVAMVGEELDLDIIELLTTSLLVQATRAMAAQTSRTRSFRHAFLMAYAERIGERLRSGPPSDDRLFVRRRLIAKA